jgi:osmoprotectant transport system substrate-binding protein
MDADVVKKYPEVADIIGKVSPLLTTEKMQELNAKADVDGEDPQDIAHDFLTEEGLLK